MSFNSRNYVDAQEFCIEVTDGTHDSPKRKEFGKYLITSKHIKGRNIDFDNAYLISEEDFNKINQRSKVDQWDVLISMIGEYCGFCYIERNPIINYAVKNVGILKAGTEAKAKWIYYYLNSPEGKNTLASLRSGTSQPYLALGALRKLPIYAPNNVKEIDLINHILSILDDKIELNNRMNKVLEQMAQAIFKQWFVDFEFPNDNGDPYKSSGGEMEWCEELGKEIPKGWRFGKVTDVLDINPKRSLKKGTKAIYLEMKNLPAFSARATDWIEREFTSGSKFINGDVLLARITPCLENGKTIIVDFLNAAEVGWGSTEFIVLRSKNEHALGFAYFLARSEDFRNHAIRNMSGSSGRQRVPESCFEFLLMPLPPSFVLEQFGKITDRFLQRMKRNGEEVKVLSILRDTLLPKLMSGEIDVSEIEL
ncbi:restriction endonuclease subunit S [Paenibacillus flagellatus]|nr:restriction endonuclease subunit S [Paenibacillus flagellatus]